MATDTADPTAVSHDGQDHSVDFPFAVTSTETAETFGVNMKTYLDRLEVKEDAPAFKYIATGALVFNKSTNPPTVLILKRASTDTEPNRWELPAGGVKLKDCTILDALARELQEESELKARRVVGGPVSGSKPDPEAPHHPPGDEFKTGSGRHVCKYTFIVEVEVEDEGRQPVVKLKDAEHQAYR